MKTQSKMWCVLTHCHPATGTSIFIESTLSYYKKDSIKKFTEGSGNTWNYWKRKFNYRCEKVTVTIEVALK